jgi:hypothetical protein
MVHTQREQIWQQRITDWQASGLSGMAYCKQQSLTYCRFVYWRKKLTHSEPELNEVASSGFAAQLSGTPKNNAVLDNVLE